MSLSTKKCYFFFSGGPCRVAPVHTPAGARPARRAARRAPPAHLGKHPVYDIVIYKQKLFTIKLG